MALMPGSPSRRSLEQQIDVLVGRGEHPTGGAARSPRSSSAVQGRHRWGAGRVQSLMFDVDRWTRSRAVSWALQHGFRADEVHATSRYLHLRQSEPTRGWPKRKKKFGRPGHEEEVGISAVVEFSPRQ